MNPKTVSSKFAHEYHPLLHQQPLNLQITVIALNEEHSDRDSVPIYRKKRLELGALDVKTEEVDDRHSAVSKDVGKSLHSLNRQRHTHT